MHRREQIMEAITQTLTGLPTVGSRVERSRAWPVHALPAITVEQGADTVAGDEPLSYIERSLSVLVHAHVASTSTMETELNAIAAEVHAALMSDHQHGLSFVHDTWPVLDDAPDLDDAQDIPVGRLTMEWRITYEHDDNSVE